MNKKMVGIVALLGIAAAACGAIFICLLFLLILPVWHVPALSPEQSFATTPAQVSTVATQSLRAGEERVMGGAPMMFVPAGEFRMGSSDADKDAQDNEKPQHVVSLDAFWMDKFSITNAQYEKCADAGKCAPPEDTGSRRRSSYYGDPQFDDYPVIYVSWADAKQFCESADKRLPTEAEWEKAARGTEAFFYPWGNAWDQTKVYDWSSNPKGSDTLQVGSFPAGASPYDVMDMAANVSEWVADWYADDYYSQAPSHNPQGPSSGDEKVLRGSAWYAARTSFRTANRDRAAPTLQSDHIGFRCAASFSS
ncbi:MAG: SUMF1/EgtB/PvdO family nonheme iron enzyme [Chloroflexota bacterium]|nr:SUMF1/EgtB/PvdO family nonheme iron enzyme [Chloroflexota bacterium]